MRVVLSDTSPIRYLVQIDASEVLGALYGRVLVPESVAGELSQPRTPEAVKRWISQPPAWLEIVPPVPRVRPTDTAAPRPGRTRRHSAWVGNQSGSFTDG